MKKVTYIALVASLMLLLLQNTIAFAQTDEILVMKSFADKATHKYVQGEVVVKYKNDTEKFRVLKVSDVEKAVKDFSKKANVEYAEPNYIATASYVPNDPLYTKQWHFDNATYGGVGAEEAWDIVNGKGKGITVAVIDTGVAYKTYTTGSRRTLKKYFLAPDLAKTCFVQGYDFINNDDLPSDDNGHGTHVTGTIAQSTNNTLGVAGLAYETCIMPLKALDASGSGSYTTIANAIYYAANNGAKVINMSLGGSASSIILSDAVKYAYDKGVVIVAASGNNNGAVSYPAAYDAHVIAVGATRFDETRASYSNYGTSLDIVAPGGDTSVDQNNDGSVDGVLQQTFAASKNSFGTFGYYLYQGTSMATPHVAAAAAMVMSNGKAITPNDVRGALESTAEDKGTGGWDTYYGYGLLNIASALAWGV